MSDETVGQPLRELGLTDEWVCQQGVEHPLAPAADRGGESEVLVRRHGRDQPGEQGLQGLDRHGHGTEAVDPRVGMVKGKELVAGKPAGPGALALREELPDIQYGRREDKHGWLLRLDA